MPSADVQRQSASAGGTPLRPRASIGVPMHHNGTAVLPGGKAGPVSPVISGEGGWLGDDDRDQPLTLQLGLPVSAEELAAALYGEHQLTPAGLATDVNVWAFAALAIVQDGLNAIRRRASDILVAEARGTLARPEWLELCRRRVAEVTGCADTPAAALSSSATTTARAGAQPPGTTTFPRPRTSKETAPAEPGTRAEGLAYVRALTQIAAPCRGGN